MIDPVVPSEFETGQPPKRIEFTRLPKHDLLKVLDRHLRKHPNTVVRFFGNEGDWTSLSFLEHIPHVQRLLLQNSDVTHPISDLSPLRSVSELRELNIPWIAKRKMDFSPLLDHVSSLCNLSIWAERSHTQSYFETLARLAGLRILGLPFGDFQLLANLKKIIFLNLGSGPFENDDTVMNLTELRHLRMLRSKISDLSPYIAGRSISSIELLKMPDCGVHELPSNSMAEFVYIDGFKSITSFDSLSTFHQLESLVIRSSHLPPSHFTFLRSCRNLQKVFVEYASRKKMEEFASHIDDENLVDRPFFPVPPSF